MTNGELLDALDDAGYPLKSIEYDPTQVSIRWTKVTFHVRGTTDETKVFYDWQWPNCFAQAYRKLVIDKPPIPVIDSFGLGDHREILVNGVLYLRAP